MNSNWMYSSNGRSPTAADAEWFVLLHDRAVFVSLSSALHLRSPACVASEMCAGVYYPAVDGGRLVLLCWLCLFDCGLDYELRELPGCSCKPRALN